METKKQGISIQSQHGFVNIQFHKFFQGLPDVDDPDSKYITTITSPDGSVMRIITDSGGSVGSYANRLRSAIHLVLENNPMWADVIHTMEDAQDNRRETALDEVKTADLWEKSEPRYWVTLIADEVDGYSEVPITLFHTEMSNEELARLVVLSPFFSRSALVPTFRTSKKYDGNNVLQERGERIRERTRTRDNTKGHLNSRSR